MAFQIGPFTEIPLFQIFLTVLLVLIVGLIIMVLQLRRLNKLINSEGRYISRMETDIGDTDYVKKKKDSKPLSNDKSIHKTIDKGPEKDDLSKSHPKKGNEVKERIDRAFPDRKQPVNENLFDDLKNEMDEDLKKSASSGPAAADQKAAAEARALEYIRGAIAKRYSRETIKMKLIESGWTNEQADRLFSML